MNNLTNDVKKVLGLSETFALYSDGCIDSMHLLIALVSVEGSFSREILVRLGFNENIASSYLVRVGNTPNTTSAIYSSMVEKIMNTAVEISVAVGYKYLDTQHVLLALTHEEKSLGSKILLRHGINYETILSIVNGMSYHKVGMTDTVEKSKLNVDKNVSTDTKSNLSEILLANGTDLTERARQNKFLPLFGRENEIERIIRILLRKYKNNPIIVGEPGVGKTAIVEGLAKKIVDNEVPDCLKNKTIYSLNVNSLVSGTRYRGELEEKLNKILEELRNRDIILFIDEMHNIMSAGNSDSGMNIGNILKPVLIGGEMSTIGATTVAEYRKYIEKDSALERRFMVVNVEEPSEKNSIVILRGIRENFERHHSIRISDEAINSAVELSKRYINDRFLPDKAIDVIDECCSKNRGREEAIGIEDIKEVIAEMTGIPITKINEKERLDLLGMEGILAKRVKGQEDAVAAICKAIRRARSGLKDSSRPVGSFMFLGPTGVGKTEMAKTLANFLFGSENALIRLDMSEYMEKISASKLIGSPPGYVGYEEGGILTEAVRKKPYSIILLDEIEKAHADVFDILLQVLDDGRLTDAKGRTVDFKNTILIMTGNVGNNVLKKNKKVGFGESKIEEDKEFRMEELKRIMRPEFLNRIDNIIIFNKLSKENITQITELLVEGVEDVLKAERNVTLEVSREAIEYMAKKAYDEEYGARPLKRLIETELEDPLSDEILNNDLKNTAVTVDEQNGRLIIKIVGGK